MSDEHNEEGKKIPLDGTFGAGVNADLTIITRNPQTGAEREETFTVPAAMVNHETLMFFYKSNLILGFKLVKHDKLDELKELGLQ